MTALVHRLAVSFGATPAPSGPGDALGGAEAALRELELCAQSRMAVCSLTQQDAEKSATPLACTANRLFKMQELLEASNRQLEECVARRTAEIEEANKHLAHQERLTAVGQLAAGIAHEVNNPLFAVIANLEFLRGDVPSSDPERGAVLDETLEGARRIQEIVSDLKTFARSDSGERPNAVEPRAAIRSALGLAGRHIQQRARLDEQYDAAPYVMGLEGRLVQVFLNLLLNAAQAITSGNAESNSVVVHTSTDDDGCAVIEIRDTGPGIAEENMARIFEPFFTTKPVGKGTGLGLSVCHGLVSEMGGRLQARNGEHGGAIFTVTLPACEPDELTRSGTHPICRTSPTRGRVLIIDDDVSVLRAMKRVLAPHDVVLASSGASGLALLPGPNPFDLVLCDLTMPELGGAEVFEHACARLPTLRESFVFMSGGVFTSSMQRFVDTVENLVLHKPIDVNRLRQLIADRVNEPGKVRLSG